MAFTSILRKSASSLAPPLAIRLTGVHRNYRSSIFTALNHRFQSKKPAVNRFYCNAFHSSIVVALGNPITAYSAQVEEFDPSIYVDELVALDALRDLCLKRLEKSEFKMMELMTNALANSEEELAYINEKFVELESQINEAKKEVENITMEWKFKFMEMKSQSQAIIVNKIELP